MIQNAEAETAVGGVSDADMTGLEFRKKSFERDLSTPSASETPPTANN
jgi:hypothetical protein